MYQFLRGIVTEKISEPVGAEKLILDVNGMGYELCTSLSSLGLFGKKGDTVTVYTTLIHKEDGMTLFGFPTLLEREMFNLLFSVSGIGPKTALNILSSLTVSEVCHAIINEEPKTLSQAQGVGQKTGERIVLELKEKIKNWQHLPIAQKDRAHRSEIGGQGPVLVEARSVLQALGYSSRDINEAFSKANGHGNDAEELVHFSLKWLSKVSR